MITSSLQRHLSIYGKRRLFGARFPNVSFEALPLEGPLTHPVWRTHVLNLSERTSWPWPGKTLHVTNRPTSLFRKLGYRYIAEVENIFSLLTPDYTKRPDFRIDEALERIERELDTGRVRRVVFQSQGAYDMSAKWFSPRMREVARTVQIVPERLDTKQVDPEERRVRVLIVGQAIYRKGLFMLPRIIAEVRKQRPEMHFTCVSTEPVPFLADVDGLDVIEIWRMSDSMRKEVYDAHHFVLNLTLSDALGVYLESLRFNTPMIGYPGQHGGNLVPADGGIMLEPPLFVYADHDFDRHYSIASFPDYVRSLHEQGFFDDAERTAIDALIALPTGDAYQTMLARQHAFAKAHFQVDDWLRSMAGLYAELD